MRIPSWVPVVGSKDEAVSPPPVVEVASTGSSKKRGSPLKVVVIVLVVLIVLGGVGFGAKKFLLKPKATTATSTTATATKAPATTSTASATSTSTTSAGATASKGGTWQGTVVRAGMKDCGVNRSHIFIIAGPEGETEVRLTGVDSLHFGPITQQVENQADALMRGKRVAVIPSKKDTFWEEATVTLDDGKDMAETLAAAGLVQEDDGASSAVRQACTKAQEQKRGIYGML